MKVVVTGAMGHIGSRLIRALGSVAGNELVLIDNLSTQRFPSLFNLPEASRYRFLEADVLTAPLRELFAGADAVVHLAALTDAASSFGNAEKVEQNNYEATKLVADACAAQGVPLVFLSTTSVYGTTDGEVDESAGPDQLKPQSPYAQSKLRAEEFLAAAGKSQGLKFITCRFGTIFGISPGIRFHTAVNKFCWQAAMGLGVTVWRTALHQVRPYLDLEDGVRAIQFILEKKLFTNQIYNVLTLNASVSEILDVIRERVPALSVRFVDERIMNQLSYNVARRKFEAEGFRFQGNLKKAIHETLDLLWTAGGESRVIAGREAA